MAKGFGQGVSVHLRALLCLGSVSEVSDSQLLERFLETPGEGSEVAFTSLIQRHGPMVLGVCRRILKDAEEAEDAFQATFLILARKAQSIRSRDYLGAWLLGVARKVALRAKSNAQRRRFHERLVAESASRLNSTRPGTVDEIEILLEQVERLPIRLREPVVLYYLQGQSYERSAQTIRLTEGMIRGRLARARELLRVRLAERGLSPGLLVAGTLPRVLAEAMPSRLVEPVLQFATKIIAGEATTGIVSVSVRSLMEGVLKAMMYTKLKTCSALALAMGLITIGASLQVHAWQKPDNPPKVTAQAEPQGETAELGDLVQGRIVRSAELTKDCMVLSYMPDWRFGNVDNLGISSNNGGVRTLVDWPDVPATEAKSSDLKFFLTFFSRKTTSHAKPGSIAAFELTSEWPERTSWKTLPTYEPEPIGSTRFEPGDGWKVFEITSMVRDREGRSGHGLLLRFLNEDRSDSQWSGYQLVSREGEGEWAKRRPMLLVVEPSKK